MINEEWDEHFKDETVEKQVMLTDKEESLKIFYKYLKKEGLIIDLGCGLGKHLLYWHSKGYKITGIDAEPRCINKIKLFCPNADAKEGDILSLQYDDETFDFAISCGVIEHFEEGPNKALNEMKRILKRNGIAFVSVPYNNYLYRFNKYIRCNTLLRKLMGKKPINKSINHESNIVELLFTKKEIMDHFAKTGFKILEAMPLLTKWGFCNIFRFLRSKSFPHNPTYETLLDPPLTSLGNYLYQVIMKFNPWLIAHFQFYVIKK
jgi:2-polyprenyl-3-methyl-5-hydroxy-6-metoxy-1,4-benzoquinol methylase